MRLLIAEDERGAGSYLVKGFSEAGFTVDWAETGTDALHQATENAYDVMILDVGLPGMDGWEFMEEYNQLDDNQLAKTVIVMLSTSLNPADRDKANSISLISGFMSKPLTAEKLEELHGQYFKAYNELER